MKKYFLYAVILFLGLTSFTAQSVWGQDADYSSKFWTRASGVMDKDPDKEGRKIFEKLFASQLSLWSSDTTQISAMKQGLNEFLDRLSKSENGPKACEVAADVMFAQLKEVVLGKEKDVVRINAVIMIGELNSSLSPKVTPYAKARPFLKELLKSKEPAIQIAALSGLALHVNPQNPRNLKDQKEQRELNIRSEEKEELAKIFAQYAFAPLAKGDAIGTPEAQWMRIFSLEALGNLGIAGPKNEYAVKLLESATTQSKPLESPYFRRDMDRRIMAALAFSKLKISEDALRDLKKKPAEISEIMTKLFLSFMKYEYDYDFDLMENQNGDEMGGDPSMRRAIVQMTPEEEAFQIRLWKQRTKAVAMAFSWIFTNKESNLVKMMGGDSQFKKVAQKISGISTMYDRAGLPKKKRPTRSNDPENPEIMPEESMIHTTDGRLSLYTMQKDMRTALMELGEEAGIPVNIEKKKRQTDMYY
ncbi:MAG: HEAT repeat domain-containing protein [Thermoguttaceae bacterium]|nr:HEAT repeat domain-containing protein [Thermoguttaceae bacterium]MBR0190794.1 HEAT repeat domain-containing protein [Thermoguttaceae bacterium]